MSKVDIIELSKMDSFKNHPFSGSGDKTIRVGDSARLINKEDIETKNIDNSDEANLLEDKGE